MKKSQLLQALIVALLCACGALAQTGNAAKTDGSMVKKPSKESEIRRTLSF